MPPEKSTPTTLSFGFGVALAGSGSTLGSSTRTIVTVRCVLVGVVGVGEIDRVAGEQRSDIDVEAGLRAGGDRACRRSCGRTARATSRRRSGRPAPARRPARGRASRSARRSCPSRTRWRRSDRRCRRRRCRAVIVPTRALGRVDVPERGRRSASPWRRKSSSRRWSPTSCVPERGEDVDLVVVGRDHLDVHQLRELIDVEVALVLQRRGRRVLHVGQAELPVDRGDLRIAAFAWLTASDRPSSASLRSPWMSAVMPLRCCASVWPGGQHAIARGARVRRGRRAPARRR